MSGPVLQSQNALPADKFGTQVLDESSRDPDYGLGLGQNASLLRAPQLTLVAPTRDDLAVKRLTDSTLPLFARVPASTTTALVFNDATLRPASMRPIGPEQHLIGEYEDYQFHPTIASTEPNARGGKPPTGPASALASAWRYPYDEIGPIAASGLLTSQLNFQENKYAQEGLNKYAAEQQEIVMPGATQMYGFEGDGIFGTQGVDILGSAPVARTQGVLTVVPASGAVMRDNDAEVDSLAALDNIEDRAIQGERVLAYDNTLRQVLSYKDEDQFAFGKV